MPDVVKKQTIKQAKASFKARGRPTLSEREARQLERSIELEQRAERAKEAEKRRLIAAGKRSEKEKREQAQRQQQVQLGTQRRCDRFGYKSSQFHLGAFFGKKPATTSSKLDTMREDTNDGFGDDDLDDESLLDACDGPVPVLLPAVQTSKLAALMPPPARPAAKFSKPITQTTMDMQDDFDMDDESLLDACGDASVAQNQVSPLNVQTSKPTATSMLPPPRPSVSIPKSRTLLVAETQDDFGDFFDDLDCGTQMAREFDRPVVKDNGPVICVPKSVQHFQSIRAPTASPAKRAAAGLKVGVTAPTTKTSSDPRVQDDVSDFFDDLESGTQIARELGDGAREMRRASDASGSSFGSGSLDLTEEDVEMMMDPPSQSVSVSASPSLATTASWPKSADRQTTSNTTAIRPGQGTMGSMQPPTAILKPTVPKPTRTSPPSMLPPALPMRRLQTRLIDSNRRATDLNSHASSTNSRAMGTNLRAMGTNPRALGANPRATSSLSRASSMPKLQVTSAIRGPFLPASSLYCSPDLGFTSTQLESFIDDELQLTQVG